ncbi:hypothetical protein [Corynebacterium alimapuense]|uniref:Uncharacterized protein n=1 Tax=Corynebacterium alimapuense TaxID=1576874 RepID=A0A3M8K815_9CORY|nr:hypothetical protein [Corynebacterium alimapuense]RNE49019.1 hypothetical protein C5L39_06975 [Corynebacterium alimapuense]
MTMVLVVAAPIVIALFALQMERLESAILSPRSPEAPQHAETQAEDDAPTDSETHGDTTSENG